MKIASRRITLLGLAIPLMLTLLAGSVCCSFFIARHVAAAQTPSASPSDDQQLAAHSVQPADLAKELSGSSKPVIVCVAPHALYLGARVPGALYHGATSTPEGLADLKKWARGVPKSTNLVLYCGCCPMTRCPNIRPAFSALQKMGFNNVRVLWLPKDFYTDWNSKGYPIETGK
jgi:hypothetical protein